MGSAKSKLKSVFGFLQHEVRIVYRIVYRWRRAFLIDRIRKQTKPVYEASCSHRSIMYYHVWMYRTDKEDTVMKDNFTVTDCVEVHIHLSIHPHSILVESVGCLYRVRRKEVTLLSLSRWWHTCDLLSLSLLCSNFFIMLWLIFACYY